MKITVLLLLLLFMAPALQAQRFYRKPVEKLNQTNPSKEKQGKWVELSGDKVKSITHYKNDQLHGVVIRYWGNGKLRSEEEYRNNTLHGYFRDYYRAGGKNRKGTYKRGLREGLFTKYWPNGEKRTEANFQDDLENGLAMDYYKDGTLRKEVPYEQGIVKGELKSYDKYRFGEKLTRLWISRNLKPQPISWLTGWPITLSTLKITR